MDTILNIAWQNEIKAYEIIKSTKIIEIWKSVGAEINLVGSLQMGLLMKHLDIDFHIYTPSLNISESFRAIARLAENPSIIKIEYSNLIETEEECIEWHAWYRSPENEIWTIDMIHILRGSRYDGYFERVAEIIKSALTPEQKNTILRIKYDTPESEKIMGIEYYQAVIRDGVKNYDEFRGWRKKYSTGHIIEWMP